MGICEPGKKVVGTREQEEAVSERFDAELLDAVKEYGANGREDIIETLVNLVEGKRLKDISDLPLDLSV